jgi:hypothetical protein
VPRPGIHHRIWLLLIVVGTLALISGLGKGRRSNAFWVAVAFVLLSYFYSNVSFISLATIVAVSLTLGVAARRVRQVRQSQGRDGVPTSTV